MKTVVAFFYLMNGGIVSYTVSDYDIFRERESIPAARTCALLISDLKFIQDVRNGLKPGESMRASCFSTDDLLVLGEPVASVDIRRD